MIPLAELASDLRAGTTALPAFLSQLEKQFRRREPAVLAFVPEEGRFERLRHEAEALLARYPEPAERPPLFGVPVGVKDIFHVKGFTTRAGSQVPPEALQGSEAPVVAALKEAGALMVGKTVTTEFAYFAPGPTRNPHNPEHTPGGSSSGSAAAVAAGLCALALGTQTIGSINRPAAFCGVVGYKPSYERISRQGVVPLSPSLDHVGLFTADVAGVRLAASLLCAGWQEAEMDREPALGIPEGPYLKRASPEGLAHFRRVAKRLGEAGLTIRSVEVMPDFDAIVERHNRLVAAEAAEVHADWFARYGDCYHSKTADLIRRGHSISKGEIEEARQGREALRQELLRLMGVHQIDLWISPAAPGAAPHGLESTGDPVMNLPWTHSGLPTLTLPAGKNETGLPLGLQLIGHWYEDEAMLAWVESVAEVLSGGQ